MCVYLLICLIKINILKIINPIYLMVNIFCLLEEFSFKKIYWYGICSDEDLVVYTKLVKIRTCLIRSRK